MTRIARWCCTHRLIVVLLWLAALVGLGIGQAAAGSAYNDDFAIPDTESNTALELLQKAFPNQAGETDTVVWRAGSGSVRDPTIARRMSATLDRISRIDHVVGVVSPYAGSGAKQISADGRIAYATVTFDAGGPAVSPDAVKELVDTATSARTAGLTVEVGGSTVAEVTGKGGHNELYGIAAAAVILLLAYGSLLGMLLPIVVALVALGCGLLVTGLVSNVLDIATVSPTVGTLIGLGVGIDYALFIVTRHRTGLKAGLGPRDAAAQALNTSGRAVLFAGGTVCVALLGLLVLGVSFLTGIAIAAAIFVLLTAVVSITLLPALLTIVGNRVLNRRERRRLAGGARANRQDRPGFWGRWAAVVARRPAALAVVAGVIMIALAAPTLSLRLGFADQGTQPPSSTTRKAYDLIADGFGPGVNGPLLLVAELRSSRDETALDELTAQLAHVAGVAAAGPAIVSQDRTTGIVPITPTTSPQDDATSELIIRLRTEVAPAFEQGHSLQVHVGGLTAITDDFATTIGKKLPLFIGVVVALGCLLLMLAFRSVLIPLTAALMNLLAAAATFGVVVVVFQRGWGENLLDLGAGPVEAFLPVFLLAVLFGLSMDYQVFLVSRITEEWVRTRHNGWSVSAGIIDTSRVITTAALIMIFVFGSFIVGGQRLVAELGLGMAVAIALDAFVLRTVLVPAVMHLLGRSNWWLPRWLDRAMPHLSVEAPTGEHSALLS